MKRILFIFAFCYLVSGFSQIIPISLLTDWTMAGVLGGIPDRTTIYTTLNPGATAAQIQTAINN